MKKEKDVGLVPFRSHEPLRQFSKTTCRMNEQSKVARSSPCLTDRSRTPKSKGASVIPSDDSSAGTESKKPRSSRKKASQQRLAKKSLAEDSGSGANMAADNLGYGRIHPRPLGIKVTAQGSALTDHSETGVPIRPVKTAQSMTKPHSQTSRETSGRAPLGRRSLTWTNTSAMQRSGFATRTSGEFSSQLSQPQAAGTPMKDSSLLRSRRGARCRSKATCKWVAAEAAAIMTITCALLLYLLPLSAVTGALRDSWPCNTQSCRDQAEAIPAWVNDSIAPCDDFEAYACSRWTPSIDHARGGTAMMGHAGYSWIQEFRRRLDEGANSLPIAKRLAILFDSCLRGRTSEEDSREVYEIREFMRGLKIPWPEPPLPGVDPLGVMLDLVFNWDINIWFRVDLSRHTTDSIDRRNLLLQPAMVLSSRWLNVAGILHTDKFVDYWSGFHREFAPNETMRPLGAILNIRRMQKTIYLDFVHVENSELKHPTNTLLKDIDSYTPHISTRRWTDVLNENLVGHGKFVSSDGVTTMDAELLAVVDRMFANFSHEQLLDHVSWELLQIIAPLAGTELRVAKYGSARQAEIMGNNYCSTQIERAYRWLVTAVALLPWFDATARAFLHGQLVNITEAAISKVNGIPWADSESVKMVASKLRNQRTLIWPPYEPLDEKVLCEAFDSWFYENATFAQHWIRSVTRWHHMRTSPSYKRSDDSPRSYAFPHFEYDPLSNVVRVAASALFPPWYQAAGSRAALYGAIGFTFAREIIKALDVPAFDRHGRYLHTWPTEIWREASAKKTSCLRPEFDSVFPEIPALEVAHAAFLASSSDDAAISRQWSAERVFFVTACFAMCNLPKTLGRFRADCNKAFRNFAPFAAAFKCPLNSRMNPEKKCSYFD
ncbi:hypothetical protein HPB51_008319 [Rhipicephalus microplus]|uniref:Peptidase M13 N-terminal domain-containing protein n=1 Tax=Rhipicephalus microplus TaxID=6941 RepID=A0A9J6EYY5_RHIMP|nr:endothelin-converting enzyme-like 1 [Rhipicephalus microplus]KAH8039726.1 hypothetical protein HPB51_008319 [Rhipicephalus microplus]